MNKVTLLLLSALLFSLGHSYGCCDANTLQIVGAGTVQVQPDIAQFSVTALGEGSTSAVALSNVNRLVNQVAGVLKSYNLPTANYSTSSINLSPRYNYSNGFSKLVGQQASQSLSVTVGNLANNKNLLGNIATSLAAINNITLSGFSFTTFNTSAAYRLARKTAVANAQATANQYCALSGLQLGAVRKVVDQNQQSFNPYVIDTNYYALQAKILPVPYGQVSVTAYVEIDWLVSS